MSRSVFALMLCVAVAVAIAGPAAAGDGSSETDTTVTTGSDGGRFYVAGAKVVVKAGSSPSTGTTAAGNTSGPPLQYEFKGYACEAGGLALCVHPFVCSDGSYKKKYLVLAGGKVTGSLSVCPTDPQPANLPQPKGPTLTDIALELKKIAVPRSQIVVQPPGGSTLVNLPTVMSTQAREFTAVRTVVGATVTYTIRPVRFVWHFGDGTPPVTTTDPGRRWVSGDDAKSLFHHVYSKVAKGVQVRVDTTWGSTYTTSLGTSGSVPDQIHKPGESVSLAVLEARPVLTE